MRIVEVKWSDSASNGEWHRPKIKMGLARAKSVGYLKQKTKRKVVLVQSIGENQLQGLIAIPRSCVKRIRKLK